MGVDVSRTRETVRETSMVEFDLESKSHQEKQ